MWKKTLARVGIALALLGGGLPAYAQEMPEDVSPSCPLVMPSRPTPRTPGRVITEVAQIELPGSTDFAALPSLGNYALESGHTYVFETVDLSPGADTVIELRRANGPMRSSGDAVVAQNDDARGSLASRIEWTADASGDYYLHVRPYDPSSTGTFGLRVVEVAPRRVLFDRASANLPEASDFASRPAFGNFTFQAGHAYVIETFGLTGATDTVLEVRRASGPSRSESDPVVAENDDADGLASRVVLVAPESGEFYASVRRYAPGSGGTFGIRVLELPPGEVPGASTR